MEERKYNSYTLLLNLSLYSHLTSAVWCFSTPGSISLAYSLIFSYKSECLIRAVVIGSIVECSIVIKQFQPPKPSRRKVWWSTVNNYNIKQCYQCIYKYLYFHLHSHSIGESPVQFPSAPHIL